MLTVKQVAEFLNVSMGQVTQLIDSGELVAIDVSLTASARRRLRVPQDALREFLERRRILPPAPPRRSRTFTPPKQVVDYFAKPPLEQYGRRRLTIGEVAEYLGLSEDAVRQLIAYGHLTAINAGGPSRNNRYRIPEKDLFAFIERCRHQTTGGKRTIERATKIVRHVDKHRAQVDDASNQ